MIYGIGVDLVRIGRVDKALTRFGDRFAQRILTASEFRTFQQNARPAAYLAKRFAAKEALLKALGTGLRRGLSWQQIEVCRNELGKPYIVCNAYAQELLERYGIVDTLLSLSDEDDYAIAFVTLVKG